MAGVSAVLQEVNNFVESKLSLYATPIYSDVFPDGTEKEIMSRHDPSTYEEQRYMDESRTGLFMFAYYTKSTSLEEARTQLSEMLDLLDLPDYIDLNGVCQVKITPVTSPAFVSKTDKNEYIYTASLGLEYYQEG